MALILVTVVKTAEVEVEVGEHTIESLVKCYQCSREELEKLSELELAEVYISFTEGVTLDLSFERHITAVSELVCQ